MRVLEFVGLETIANRGVTWGEAFPSAPPFGAKLASDVVRFLVGATGLDRRHVEHLDGMLGPTELGRPTKGDAAAAMADGWQSSAASPDAPAERPALFADEELNDRDREAVEAKKR